MNRADSERLAAHLEHLGYEASTAVEDADLVVLNSCVVRQSAENRVLSKIGSLKPLKRRHPHLLIALTGCLVDSRVDELKRRFPFVDFFFKPQAFDDLILPLSKIQGISLKKGAGSILPARPAVSTFVPIIQGCNNFCSYCIVPYRRGRERSRPVNEIICEVEELTRRGAREVVLLGQNVDSYGHDLPTRPDLADLLEELNGVEGLARIRFLTSHPKDMSEKLIEKVARLDKVCEHINLPVQAGDDDILRAMRRGYTVEHYRKLAERIRSMIPGVAISTDVIVGFPGETEAQFERTVNLLCELRFDKVHVACYSPRRGTIASRRFKDDVPPAEKKRRLKVIEELEERIAAEINARLLGETVEVLVEGQRNGKWHGRTRTNKLVFFSDNADRLGQLVRVKIDKTSPWALQGRVDGGE